MWDIFLLHPLCVCVYLFMLANLRKYSSIFLLNELILVPFFYRRMGFSVDLQGRSSHEALMHFLDEEIGLMETMKKCIMIRLEGDKKYVEMLSNFLQAAQKIGTVQFETSIYKVNNTIMKVCFLYHHLIPSP